MWPSLNSHRSAFFPSSLTHMSSLTLFIWAPFLKAASQQQMDSHLRLYVVLTRACLTFQVRRVWTNPASAGEGLDPPGHRQALPLSGRVSAQTRWFSNAWWMNGHRFALSGSDSQLSPLLPSSPQGVAISRVQMFRKEPLKVMKF